MAEYVPGIVKGYLVEVLSKVSVAEAVDWVGTDRSLYDQIPENYKLRLKTMKLGKMNWLTADWGIEALKDKRPALASLFASWLEGHYWLECQCKKLKDEFSS